MHRLVEMEEAAWENAADRDGAELRDDRQQEEDVDADNASPDDPANDDEHDAKQEEETSVRRVICLPVRTRLIYLHFFRAERGLGVR